MEVPYEILALFERSKEHLSEMVKEYGICIKKGIITPRAKIITHQALSLCRHALDHAMRFYWNEKWSDRLSEKQKSGFYLVYFPVAWSEEDFPNKLHKYKMDDLRIYDPTVYNFLFNCQLFNNENYQWLYDLNALAGEGKHEHLIEQKRIDYTHYTLEYAPEGKVIWGVSTTKVDPNNIAQKRYEYIGSEELPEDRGLIETVKQRSSFTIKKIEREALLFCYEAREKAIELVKEFFQLF